MFEAIGLVENAGEHAVRARVLRFEGEDALVGFDSELRLARFVKEIGEVLPGWGEIGAKHKRAAVRGDRLVRLPEVFEGLGEVVVRFGVSGIGGDGLTECSGGFGKAGLASEGKAVGVERLGGHRRWVIERPNALIAVAVRKT